MDVGLDGISECQAQFLDQREVAFDRFKHWIDQRRPTRFRAGDEISIG